MQNNFVFLPVAVQILLTVVLYARLAITRAKASQHGLVNEERRALYDDAWPDHVVQVSNCLRNQFEAPVLFYVLVISLWLVNGVNLYVHIFAWAFVLSRIVHASVHLGSNAVPLRRTVFILGGLNIVALTVFLVYSITAGA
ncbi:MAG: MAPEG family protein [Halioglobus sp.]